MGESANFERELAVAVEAVKQAAVVCRQVQRQITASVLEKKDRSPVTVADFASQAVICRSLGLAFPTDAVIAEEDSAELRTGEQSPFRERIVGELKTIGIDSTADQVCDWIDRGRTDRSCDRFWTLDPIDGTKGFLRGEQYAVSLALIVDGRIRLGVLGCPNLSLGANPDSTGVVFFAVAGQAAFATPLEGTLQRRPLRVRSTHRTAEAVICESVESGHSDHEVSKRIAAALGVTAPSVRMDSQAKYAAVARGDADIYLRLPTRADYREKIWDHAGGVLVVEEAGGKVTDIAGKPLEWTHGRELSANRGVLVATPGLHDAVLEAVRTQLPG